LADVVRRFRKLLGDDVRYLCGADENALKIVQAADKAGKNPQEFTDLHQAEFLNLAEKLNIQFDVWQRGTDKTHHYSASQKLWELCVAQGDIYKKSYSGLYCVGCEAFYTPEELDEKGECLEHPGKKLEKITEENYFFKLSKYQDFLEKLIETDTLKITPETRKNEVLAFIRQGLDDFSISRSVDRAKGWGVPVPGDDSQIMYVWFDALNIYQSGIGFGWDDENYKKWWPADLHVIGKGIIRFHAVYWPAILQSAGLLQPKQLFVHGYLTVDGQKMSKTIGNVVDPISLIEKYGADAVRFYLLREIPSYSDGDFSERRFVEIYNADLANELGNLVSRVAKLCEGLEFKPAAPVTISDKVYQALETFRFDQAIATIWEDITTENRYLNETAPWNVADDEKKQQILSQVVDHIRSIAYHLQPFLPETAEKILNQFGTAKITTQAPYFKRIV
jgi:methionyl-tRNA synthetase